MAHEEMRHARDANGDRVSIECIGKSGLVMFDSFVRNHTNKADVSIIKDEVFLWWINY